jgi:squalene cyclase
MGGWAFVPFRGHPPDNDTTAMVLRAIREYTNLDLEERNIRVHIEKASKMGLNFLLRNQRNDGGWATYGLGNCKKPKGAIPSIRTNPWWTQKDPPVADITGHALSALSLYDLDDNSPIRKAIKFLERDQTIDGYWYARWAHTFIYGTASVIEALSNYTNTPKIQKICDKAVDWIESIKNMDGWGESPDSYHKESYIKGGISTESTAWTVIALSSYGNKRQLVNYLVTAWNNAERIPSINAAAFDVYTNTIYPYAFTLLAVSYCEKGGESS